MCDGTGPERDVLRPRSRSQPASSVRD